jgi:hypothetical protein
MSFDCRAPRSGRGAVDRLPCASQLIFKAYGMLGEVDPKMALACLFSIPGRGAPIISPEGFHIFINCPGPQVGDSRWCHDQAVGDVERYRETWGDLDQS